MSFLGDKKREHEAQAEKALAKKDYARAFFHTAKAAELGLALAEQSEGQIAQRHTEDAMELIGLAEQMKTKAESQKASVRQTIKAEQKAGEADEDDASSYRLQGRPDIRLGDVAGLTDVKETLHEKVILPFQHPEVYQQFRLAGGGGVLLYGPPGNGKTFVAKAVAGELDAAFFEVRLSEMKSKYVGETAKNLTRLFDEARGHDRSVLFLDECEALLAKRGNRKVDSVPQFLALTDGLMKNENVMLLLAATNKPWQLDDAVLRPGRLGTHIYVGLPDAEARTAILDSHMKGVPLAPDVNLAEISIACENYSGADMAEISRRAKQEAVKRQIDTGQPQTLTNDDFAQAVRKIRPSTTADSLAEFHKWRDERSASETEDDE